MRMGVGGRVGHAAAYLKEDHSIHFKKGIHNGGRRNDRREIVTHKSFKGSPRSGGVFHINLTCTMFGWAKDPRPCGYATPPCAPVFTCGQPRCGGSGTFALGSGSHLVRGT